MVSPPAHSRNSSPALGADDLRAVVAFAQRLAGLHEPDVLSARAAHSVRSMLGGVLVCVTTVDEQAPSPGGNLTVRAATGSRSTRVEGLRIPVGRGVGGQVIARRAVVSLEDYGRDAATRDFLDIMVEGEGIRGAAGVPLTCGDRPVGVLFAGRRQAGPLADREVALMLELAAFLGPLMATALADAGRMDTARSDERRRLALELHDHVIPHLFAIGAAARAGEPTHEQLSSHVAAQADEAERAIRRLLESAAPVPVDQELPVALREAVAGHPRVEVVVLGEPVALPEPIVRALCAVASEALHNAAKHAGAATVVVTLAYADDAVELAVQDDGRGMPAGAEPDAGRRLGLRTLARRLAAVAGTFSAGPNDDGGVTVRAVVPLWERGA